MKQPVLSKQLQLLYKIIPFCFFSSLISLKIGGANLSIGDIVIPIIYILILTSTENIYIKKNYYNISLKIIWATGVILFLAIFSLVNIFFSTEIKHCIVEIFKLIIAFSYIPVALIYFNIINDKFYLFLKTLVYGTLFVSVLALIGTSLYMLGIDNFLVMNGFRAKSTMSDTNILGIFLLTTAPLIMYFYFNYKRKAYIIVIFIVNLLAIFSTVSKGAMLMLGVSFFIFLFYLLRIKKIKEFIVSFVFISLTLLVLFSLLKDTFLIKNIFLRLNELTSGSMSRISTGRSDLWGLALSLIDSPKNLLIGIGYGNFISYTSLASVPYYLKGITLVHNTFLSLLVESGFLCFLFFLMLFLIPIFKIRNTIILKKEYKDIFILISLVNLFIGACEVNLQNNRFLYFILLFIIFNSFKREKDNNNTMIKNIKL